MTISEIAAGLKVADLLSRLFRKFFKRSNECSDDLDIWIDDYEGEGWDDPRRIAVYLKGETASNWVVSGIEALGPKRSRRRRRERYRVAPKGKNPPAWAERVDYKYAGDGCMFQLHDEAPREFEVRVHVRGRLNTGRKACRDVPCEIIADTINWGSSPGKPAGQR